MRYRGGSLFDLTVLVGFGVAVVAAAVALIAVLRGLVLVYLWRWFVVPLWEGTPELKLGYAIGLCLISSFLVGESSSSSTPDESKEDRRSSAVVRVFLQPLLVLLMGYILKSAMEVP